MNGVNDPDYDKTNRQKVQVNHRGRFWCWSCDMALISEGCKCPVCGVKHGNRKRLKP